MQKFPVQAEPIAILVMALAEGAVETAKATVQSVRKATRSPRGQTLRPGAGTPLWNELVAALRPLLRQRGEKVQLARLLGVPRQRVHEYVTAEGVLPDAERTLLLLYWLALKRREGSEA